MDILSKIDNGYWLVSCAADRMMPKYSSKWSEPDKATWRAIVLSLVAETKARSLVDVRWDCVKSAALNRMSKYFMDSAQL